MNLKTKYISKYESLSDKILADVYSPLSDRKKKVSAKCNLDRKQIVDKMNAYFKHKGIPLIALNSIFTITYNKVYSDGSTCKGATTRLRAKELLAKYKINLDSFEKGNIPNVPQKSIPVPTVERLTPKKKKVDTSRKKRLTPQDTKVDTSTLAPKSGKIFTSAEEIPFTYAIMELAKLQPSHLSNRNFKENPNYPLDCQQRNYSLATEQYKVTNGAKNFEPTFLLNTSPTATDGSPIVNENGIVLGGNGRTMILNLLTISKLDKYRKLLIEEASIFGFTPEYIAKFHKPILVRVLKNVNLNKCSYYNNLLNTDKKQSIDLESYAKGEARNLDDTKLLAIANVFSQEELESLEQFYADTKAVARVKSLLFSTNTVNQSTMATWFTQDGSKFTDIGKFMFQAILLASVLKTDKTLSEPKSYIVKIIRNIPTLLSINTLDPKYRLRQYILEVFDIETRRRDNQMYKDDILNQNAMFEDNQIKLSQEAKILWNTFDDLKVSEFKRFYKDYLDVSENNEEDIFQSKKPNRLEILKNLANRYDITPPGLSDNILTRDHGTVRQIMLNRNHSFIRIPQNWQIFLGKVPQNFNVHLWGLQGSGKSTLALMLLNILSKFGKAIYLTREETINEFSLQQRIERVKPNPAIEFYYVKDTNQIRTAIEKTKAQYIVIDSLTKLKITDQEVDRLLTEYPNKSFILITQSQKDGRSYRGNSDVAGDVQIVIKVKDGVATTTKNRFGESQKQMKIY